MINFPSSPSVGQLYPASPVAGIPTYRWDGEKWTNSTTPLVGAPASAAAPLMDGAVTPGAVAQWSRGDHVHPRDTSRAPVASPTFTGTLTAGSFTINGDISVGGTVTANATAKGHRFGWASGQSYGAALVMADANIMLYNYDGLENWCGMGTDTGGNFWIRTGAATRVSAAFAVTAAGEATFAFPPVAPTPAVANDIQIATTAYVTANQAVGGPYLPATGGTLTGTLTINQGHVMTYRTGGNTGVLYLSSGDRYIYYDGTSYSLPGVPLYTVAGRLWGSSDWTRPVSNARIGPHAGDYTVNENGGLAEPYGGAVATGSSHFAFIYEQYGYGCVTRFRYNQIYVEGTWYTAGYA